MSFAVLTPAIVRVPVLARRVLPVPGGANPCDPTPS